MSNLKVSTAKVNEDLSPIFPEGGIHSERFPKNKNLDPNDPESFKKLNEEAWSYESYILNENKTDFSPIFPEVIADEGQSLVITGLDPNDPRSIKILNEEAWSYESFTGGKIPEFEPLDLSKLTQGELEKLRKIDLSDLTQTESEKLRRLDLSELTQSDEKTSKIVEPELEETNETGYSEFEDENEDKTSEIDFRELELLKANEYMTDDYGNVVLKSDMHNDEVAEYEYEKEQEEEPLVLGSYYNEKREEENSEVETLSVEDKEGTGRDR